MTDSKIRLSEWVANVRESLLKAQDDYDALPESKKRLKLQLQEVMLEAQIESEKSEGAGGKIQVFVLGAEGTATQKTGSTQKVVLTFKPVNSDDESPIFMGD